MYIYTNQCINGKGSIPLHNMNKLYYIPHVQLIEFSINSSLLKLAKKKLHLNVVCCSESSGLACKAFLPAARFHRLIGNCNKHSNKTLWPLNYPFYIMFDNIEAQENIYFLIVLL